MSEEPVNNRSEAAKNYWRKRKPVLAKMKERAKRKSESSKKLWADLNDFESKVKFINENYLEPRGVAPFDEWDLKRWLLLNFDKHRCTLATFKNICKKYLDTDFT